MKKRLVWLALAVGALAMTGCGNLTSAIPAQDSSNQGVISGHVYDLNASNIYKPLAGARVVAGTREVFSNAAGAYELTGIPAGSAAITVTAEGAAPQTVVVNRGSVNLYLRRGSSSTETGSSIISGVVYGLPAGVSSVYGSAQSLAKRSSSFSYDSSIYRYTLTGAPDDGETYLFAYYSSSEGTAYRSIYTYKKLTMTGASQEADLDFATSTATLTANYTLPANYRSPNLSINVFSGNRTIQNIYSQTQTQEAAFTVTSLPKLQTGDYFGAVLTASKTNTGEAAYKILAKYNLVDSSNVSLDLTTVPDLTMSGPADSASLSSLPEFAWERINDDRVIYAVIIYPNESYTAVWSGYTKNNSIAIPESINLNNGTYRWQVSAAFYSNFDLADIGSSLAQSYLNWAVLSPIRRFTYAK